MNFNDAVFSIVLFIMAIACFFNKGIRQTKTWKQIEVHNAHLNSTKLRVTIGIILLFLSLLFAISALNIMFRQSYFNIMIIFWFILMGVFIYLIEYTHIFMIGGEKDE